MAGICRAKAYTSNMQPHLAAAEGSLCSITWSIQLVRDSKEELAELALQDTDVTMIGHSFSRVEKLTSAIELSLSANFPCLFRCESTEFFPSELGP